jgi:hypothetical protein
VRERASLPASLGQDDGHEGEEDGKDEDTHNNKSKK